MQHIQSPTMDQTPVSHKQRKQVYNDRVPLSDTDVNALQNAPIGSDQVSARQSPPQSIHDNTLKTSHESDDSFSAYIEHPIKQSTPPPNHRVHQVDTRSLEQVEDVNMSRDAVVSLRSGSSEDEIDEEEDEEEEEEEEGDGHWPTVIDHGEDEEFNHNPNLSHGAIVIPDMQEQEEEDYDMSATGEKKRRRRTNKAEANVLASVFAQTQFPDAHTRETLARRLNMKPKAVSIWFQNRRQAMKKRASRFGGVEGVNGPTVTAASMQVLDVVGRSQTNQAEAQELGTEQLKSWINLNDISSGECETVAPLAQLPIADLQKLEEVEQQVPDDCNQTGKILSSAPILDYICKQGGQHRLNRMVSMPSLASLLSTKEGIRNRKDLRDLLPSNDVQGRRELVRTTSACSAIIAQDEKMVDRPPLRLQGRERCLSLQMDDEGRAAIGIPLSSHPPTQESKCTVSKGKVSFPAILGDILQRRAIGEPQKTNDIWQRMQSSSSSSSSDAHLGYFDNNKENREPGEKSRRRNNGEEEEEEDEERTLRLIAGKRAAKDLAKKEKQLSEEGKRYVLEADARVALQQRKRSSFSGNSLVRKLDKPHGPTSASQRKWNRAISDAHLLYKNRIALARVPSLDMTAGRDRSKDDERPPLRSLFEMKMSKRVHPGNAGQDENIAPDGITESRLSLPHQKKRSRYSTTLIELQSQARLSSQGNHNVTSFTQRRPDHGLLRRFAPSQSLPTAALSLLSSRLGGANMSFGSTTANRFESTRESSARLDGAQVISSSQESSENGSDDWLEAWAHEKTKGTRDGAARIANVLRDRSTILNSQAISKQAPSARHDDSGFFGSDSGGEQQDGDEMLVRKATKRSKLISQSSSSPSKRGDERDRLAAETLLGLGLR